MPPVLYLHGFASSPQSRKAVWFQERFRAAGRDVLIPDLNGGDFSGLTITGQLSLLERAAAGQPVTFIGSSLGGYLAALYAARHAEVERVVLLAPAFGFAKRYAESLGAEAVDEWRRQGWREVFHYAMQAPMRLGWTFLEDAGRYEAEPEVTQPTLILHGRRDDVVPVEASRAFAATRPHVRLVEYDSGHELTDVLEPMWAELRAFCQL